MKKDILNGKIKQEHMGTLLFSITAATLIFLGGAVMFLCIALLYPNVEYAARIILYVCSALCFIFSVVFPLATVLCVRTYPKHKKLTHLLVKKYVLTDEEQLAANNEK